MTANQQEGRNKITNSINPLKKSKEKKSTNRKPNNYQGKYV